MKYDLDVLGLTPKIDETLRVNAGKLRAAEARWRAEPVVLPHVPADLPTFTQWQRFKRWWSNA